MNWQETTAFLAPCFPQQVRDEMELLLPGEWQENLSPRDPDRLTGMTVGDWGSIYDARGCMNEKHLTMVRESGKLPYSPRKSFCSFQAMRRHLAQLNKKMDIYE